MYCNKCGNEIKEDSKFCDKCGAKVDVEEKISIKTEKIETVNREKSDDKEVAIDKYTLIKRKMLGNITTSMYYSEIEIKDNNIVVQQYKKYLNLIKGGTKSINIKIDEIQSIITQKNLIQ